jgi:hypothetical protein
MNTAVAVESSNAVPPVVSSVKEIPLRNIQESKTNPRRQFDEAKLAELADFVPGNKIRVMRRYVALPMRLRHGMHVNGAGRHIIPVRWSGTPDVSRASTGSNFSDKRYQALAF